MDDEVKSSAEEHPDWKQISADKSLLRLLEVLQSISHYYKSTQEPIYALMTIKSDMLKLKQEPNKSDHYYKDRFDGMIEVCEVHGILIHDDGGIIVALATENGASVSSLSNCRSRACLVANFV